MSETISSDTTGKHLITIPLQEIKPIGFHAKFLSRIPDEYEISFGKSIRFRLGVLYFILAAITTVISVKLFHSSSGFPLAILWSTRLLALVLVLFGILKIRSTSQINPFLVFNTTGILHQESLILWSDIKDIQVQYHSFKRTIFNLIVETNQGFHTIDISKVDEFSEDIAVILNRYIKKYVPTETI